MARKTPKQQLDNALKALNEAQNAYDLKLAEFTEQEEKAHSKRSIDRGKTIENALPELATLTKKQFDTYMEKVMLTDEARFILMELCEEIKTPAAPMGGANTEQGGGTTVEKPVGTPPNGGTGSNGNSGGNTGQ